jgi:hypothetical protein
MKKLLIFGLLVVVGVYGSGAWTFSQAHLNGLLGDWEDMSAKGDADAICDTFADDMTFSFDEHTTESSGIREGDKQELCAYLRKLEPAMARAGVTSTVTRENISVTRSWLHPWTAELSYTEHRTTLVPSRGSIRTVSNDRIALVKSLRGVLITRLESVIRIDSHS